MLCATIIICLYAINVVVYEKKSYCVRRVCGAGCCGGGLKTGNWVIVKLTTPKRRPVSFSNGE